MEPGSLPLGPVPHDYATVLILMGMANCHRIYYNTLHQALESDETTTSEVLYCVIILGAQSPPGLLAGSGDCSRSGMGYSCFVRVKMKCETIRHGFV